MQRTWILIVAAGCGAQRGSEASHGTCVDPRDYGAIVDDGNDDRGALQQALDVATKRGADVCLPEGDLHVTRRPGRGRTSIPSLRLAGTGGGIRGKGPRSRIVMLASRGAYVHDWWVFEVTGTKHALRNFSIDGSNPGPTDEQTHLIQVIGPAQKIELSQLTLAIPPRVGQRAGDCIRMLGDAGALVDGVTISDVQGTSCARSFIAFQRHVSHVAIERVTSVEVGGQAIDMEPTGDGAIHDVTIRHSHFARGTIARGGWTVALAGAPDVLARNLLLADSTVQDGGVAVYNAEHVQIRRNTISSGVADRGTIKLERDSSDVRIEGNLIVHVGGKGDAIELTNLSGDWPRAVAIVDNDITNETEGFPIHAEPVETIEILSNRIRCSSPKARGAAIYLRSVATSIASARISNNVISGNCLEAVRISQYGRNITGSVVVEGNRVAGTRFGVTFENGVPKERPVVNQNVFKGVHETDRVVGSDAQGFEGKNSQ